MRGITVVAGGARSGKTQRLLGDYRRELAGGKPGAALWLAPTQRAAVAVREQILGGDLPGCLNPNCLTFDQFARRLLDASSLSIRPIGLVDQRRILKRLVDEALAAGGLVHFAPIAHTAGFLDLLVGFVQELKRLEIWPHELRAASGARESQKNRELCRLYLDYQQILNQHDLYDAEGRFWSARARLRDGQLRPFERLSHVFVDGFTDFTRTQHEILDILAERVETLAISLPLHIVSPRKELFSKSARTLAELERRHQGLTIEAMTRQPTAWPAMDHLERSLFANLPHVDAPPEARGIEIVTAGGVTDEIEQLARRIKALLVHGDAASDGLHPAGGVRPGDVLVVFRSLAETAELVREVFAEFGIPASIGTRPPLERAPVTSALVACLRLDLDDWPFRQLLSLLEHNYFRPAWSEWRQGDAAVAAEYVVRRLQIPSGRGALAAEVERLAAAANRADPAAKPTSTLARRAALAWPLLRRMGQLLDELPDRATLRQWRVAIGRLAASAGFFHCAEPPNETDVIDQNAWQQLVDALGQSERLSSWLGGPPAELSRREFFDYLQEILRCVPLPMAHDEAGRVRVLSADSARHLSAPYLFVAGLSERAFPPPDRDDCLYSDAETRELVAAGLPLVPQAERRGHEMLLFYEVVTRATRRLVLSYPALDETAQPLSPSPYLSEIERAFHPRTLAHSELPDLSAVPGSDLVYCPRDFRVRAVAQAFEGEGALLARLAGVGAGPVAQNILSSLHTSLARQRRESFGPFEGMLDSEAARGLLAKRYGPEHCWSTSQLEQYARCPFQFFLDRVLGLEPFEELTLAVDYAGRGQILHGLLAELHRALNEGGGARVSPAELSEGALREEIERLLAEAQSGRKGEREWDGGLLEIDLRRLSMWLAEYRQQHLGYDSQCRGWDSPLRPAHFEVSFGPRRDRVADEPFEPDDPLSTRAPFELACGDETIRLAGRIDRIDLGEIAGQTVFAILDYKSGKSEAAKAKAILEGAALQLPLYALAAARLLAEQQAVPMRVAYWHVAGKGCKEVVELHSGDPLAATPEWDALMRELPARVLSLVRGVRQGQFPMSSSDEKCTSRCAFNTVCRVNQVRSLEKTWQPPEVASL